MTEAQAAEVIAQLFGIKMNMFAIVMALCGIWWNLMMGMRKK